MLVVFVVLVDVLLTVGVITGRGNSGSPWVLGGEVPSAYPDILHWAPLHRRAALDRFPG